MNMSKVIKKHENSRDCFICGLENERGIKAEFYETDAEELACVFTPTSHYQSYPGVLHGGISATILDELIGRAINIKYPDKFAMTVKLELQYKKPLPYGVQLTGVAKVVRDTRLIYEGEGTLYDDKGNICVVAKGKYMKMPLDKISGDFNAETDWFVNETPNDPSEITIHES
jgi:uncharacterized protein (TIGR00369 family)